MNYNELTIYQKVIANLDFEKWLEVIKSEIESVYVYQVWTLVDPLEEVKSISCKWIFKKKTNVNGKIHTFKGFLLTKDFKQIYSID